MFEKFSTELRSFRNGSKARTKLLWELSDKYDFDCSNDWDLWTKLSEQAQASHDEALSLQSLDPGGALAIYEALARDGDALAMSRAGMFHAKGVGTDRNREKALNYYHTAMEGGSWLASVLSARLKHKRGDFDGATFLLEQGVDADYTASMFWLAKFRYQRDPGRRIAREVWPLVETALEREHPGGRWLAAKLLARGKLGLGRIREGWRIESTLIVEMNEELKRRGDPHVW